MPQLTDSQIIALYEATGHLRFPFGEPAQVPKVGESSYPTALDDPRVMLATESYQAMHAPSVAPLIAKHHPGRAMVRVDGLIGPAMRELFETPRCWVPDYTANSFEEAQGNGGWKGCHGIGDFHAVSIRVDGEVPAHIKPHWDEVKRRVTVALDEIGFRAYWDGRSPVNITLTFVKTSSGWIGLATVGNRRETCTSPTTGDRWIQLLGTYTEGWTDIEKKIRALTLLVLHEAGHVQSLQHSPAGVGIMSPYLVTTLVPRWFGQNDPHESTMREMYGGNQITPEPPPDPSPPPGDWPAPGQKVGEATLFNGKRVLLVAGAGG